MIKLIIFDWNGTLFADTIAVMESNNQVLKALGCQPDYLIANLKELIKIIKAIK